MMKSSFCNMQTPQKKFISSKINAPLVTFDSTVRGRFSPSREMIQLLKGLDRVHLFQFHKDVTFVEIKELSFLSRKLVKEVGEYFLTECPDIPDVILKLGI